VREECVSSREAVGEGMFAQEKVKSERVRVKEAGACAVRRRVYAVCAAARA